MIADNELRTDESVEQPFANEASINLAEEASEADVKYPPGVKLFGEEKRTRDREIADEVALHVDAVTGRLRASEAQRIYAEVGRRYGLSPSGVILRTPAHLKPTNLETLEFARSQKGKQPPHERPDRPRRRRVELSESEEPPGEERRKKRDASVAQLVREAAMEFVDPAIGRIPAARATEVYHLLSERFDRTPGTVSNYLKGLTPTAAECAALRWDRHRERMKTEGAPLLEPAPEPEEVDYAAHPAALFPIHRTEPTPRRDGPKTLKEREQALRGPDGRLIDYDESYQVQRQGETLQTKLDEATEEFLRSFRVQQAAEFIDALRDCGRAMNTYVVHTQRQFQQFHQDLESTGHRIMDVAEQALEGLKHRHAHEMTELSAEKDGEIQELKEYVAALEADNARMNAQLKNVRAILNAVEDAGQAVDNPAVGVATLRVRPERADAFGH